MEQLPCFFLDQLRCCLLVTNNEKLLLASIISANICPFKVSKINNRKSCKICSKLTVKHQNDVVLVFSLLTLNRFLTFSRCQNLRATNSVDVISDSLMLTLNTYLYALDRLVASIFKLDVSALTLDHYCS